MISRLQKAIGICRALGAHLPTVTNALDRAEAILRHEGTPWPPITRTEEDEAWNAELPSEEDMRLSRYAAILLAEAREIAEQCRWNHDEVSARLIRMERRLSA